AWIFPACSKVYSSATAGRLDNRHDNDSNTLRNMSRLPLATNAPCYTARCRSRPVPHPRHGCGARELFGAHVDADADAVAGMVVGAGHVAAPGVLVGDVV